MKKRFECWNCGKTFEADESNYVECPHCGSDNVEYASFHFPRWTVKAVYGLVAATTVAAVCYNIRWNALMPEAEPRVVAGDTLTIEDVKADSTFMEETGLTKPMTIVAGAPELSDDGYSVVVSAKDAPNCAFKYVIMEAFEDKRVAESNDGKFVNIPPSTGSKGGSYRIAAVCTANDSVIAVIDVPGFIVQKKVAKKMTTQELQAMIDRRDVSLLGIGENDCLSPNYSLGFTGLSANVVNVPKILAEVFEKIDNGVWLSVTVKEVGYDDLNRISTIKLAVKEDSLDF